jgi:riboflavin synthase
MFTGIVQTIASVVSASIDKGVMRVVTSLPNDYLQNLEIGASIAINGCCLTVVKFELGTNNTAGKAYFDVIDETLKLSNIGTLKAGDKVNLERSLTFGTEIGGHIVSGHIHTLATVGEITVTENNWAVFLEIAPKWLKYINYKGFIAVNGCSLTVGKIEKNGFYLHLIPETLEVTNIGLAQKGDQFNIEIDQQTMTIVDTIERYMKQKGL